MILKQLSEIVFNFYNNGRSSATNVTFSKQDIFQFCVLAYGNILRQRYYENRAYNENANLDMIGSGLDIKEYPLSEPNIKGMRRAIITDEVIRLPRSIDVTNIYPVASGNCPEAQGDSIPLVQPGEENFYTDPEFEFFQFAVQKGKGINTYHLPSCIEKIQVERMYISNDLDVPVDIGFDVAMSVLGVSLKIQGFIPTADNSFDANKNQLRYQIEKQNDIK